MQNIQRGNKAYAIECPKYFPGMVVHYSAKSEYFAKAEALISIRKIGQHVMMDELTCQPAPEHDDPAGPYDIPPAGAMGA